MASTVRDIVVQIGSQYWLAKNIDYDRFRNGVPITQVSTSRQWFQLASAGKPGWCYYNFDQSNAGVYGKLYNWYVISASEDITPPGWKVPTKDDYQTLYTTLGGAKVAGYRLKSTENWKTLTGAPGTGPGIDDSKWSGQPGGYVKPNGSFVDQGWSGNFWTNTIADGSNSWSAKLNWETKEAFHLIGNKALGLSIRLIASGTYTGSVPGTGRPTYG